jgi:hypothetical protein
MKHLSFLAFPSGELAEVLNAMEEYVGSNTETRIESADALSALARLRAAVTGPLSGETSMGHQIYKETVLEQTDRSLVPEQSRKIVQTYPLRTNGHVTFCVLPDQSMIVWDLERGFNHPGN